MQQDFSQAFQWPPQDPAIRTALLTAFESGQWGKYLGGYGEQLLRELKGRFGLEHFQLCSSGTVAVEIALHAAGVGPGDEVILAGYDFPGNFRAIERLGAMPVLADIESRTWCLDVDSVRQAISDRTRAVIVSHLHGGVAPLDSLLDLAKEHQLRLVEDICQCPGATWRGQMLGSWGDVCALSFGGSKLLSAGRGGAVGFRDPATYQRARIYTERGNDAFPLSELQAAVLLPQLSSLADQAERRRSQAVPFCQSLEGSTAVEGLRIHDASQPDFYKVPLMLRQPESKQSIIHALRSEGIVIDHGFRGFANRSARRCRQPTDLTNSLRAAESTLVLHHPCLLSEQFAAIADRVLSVIHEYQR